MSKSQAISIFYIHSPNHNLGPIEKFLTNRNYSFACESEIPHALDMIADLQPQFIFIALDHINPMVDGLAKIIRQTLFAQVIPYVHSSAKEQTRKLDQIKDSHKLYPPLTGPNVERLIQAVLKESEAHKDQLSGLQFERPSDETIQRFKSNLKDEYIREAKARNIDPDKSYASVSVLVDKNSKEDFEKVKKINKTNNQLQSFGDIDFSLSDQVKNKLTLDFKNNYEDTFKDILRVATEYNDTISDGTTYISSGMLYSFFQCFIIKSATWCGYIVIASSIRLDANDLEIPLTAWLRSNLQNFVDLTEEDLFQIQVEKRDYTEFIKNKIEHSEKIQIDQSEINISFFAAKPTELMLILNDTQEMLEVPVEIIPTEINLPLNLYIHLPENKKYILFTSENKSLATIQKDRLLKKGIRNLFTQIVFEKQLNQLKAENHIQYTISSYKKESN